jgi:solute carrier family 41
VGQALLVLTFALALALGDTVTAAVNAGEGHGGV